MSSPSAAAYAPTASGHLPVATSSAPSTGPVITSVAGWQPGMPPLQHVLADDVRFARFRTTPEGGYVQEDVDAFLDQVEGTLRRWEEQHASPGDAAGTSNGPGTHGDRPGTVSPASRPAGTSGLTRVVDGPGYAEEEVDTLLEHAAVALELLRQGVAPEMTAAMVDAARFRTTWNSGYDQREVDVLLDQVAAVLRG
ncbi:DivIVA domain-containing protein [Actinotalea sp. C106]|uniref:DivIVA domain-containing protein n=1 Tax=Actinotalea sp. C106 TaxID=2908644 RepID=UPI002028AC96|nr:DivIVA domain-containing protein [Actinotalea sp. C106]